MNYNDFKDIMNKNLKALEINLNEEQMQKFFKFMNFLIEKNKVMNLTSINDPEEIILKHFVDSLTISKHIKDNQKVIDVGTGAGFPGLPLKFKNDSLDMVLLDSLNKRINFLNEVIEDENLEKIEAVHQRAEDLGRDKDYREMFDCAVSRAVAPLNILVEYMLPFVKINGMCICMKGKLEDEELNNGKKAIEILGGKISKIDCFNLPNTDNSRTIILIKKEKNTHLKFPRKAGEPKKNPLK